MHPPESKSKPPAVILLEDTPTYSHFLHEYLQKNKPCLISSDSVTSWPAFALWVDDLKDVSSRPGADYSQPNFDYLRENYGDQIVSVARCSSRAFSDQEREERPLREVIDLWKCGHGKELYVKDWHLAKSVREKGYPPFYTTPQIFRDDWMNAFWEEEGKDDFRFVYMGAAGTFTPLHRDVYTSYSWSTNITGTKIWYLFPPSVSHHLRRYPSRPSSEIVYDVRDVDLGIFKEFDLAQREMLVAEQPSGCTIFVPSGWYHQVVNVTHAISINHNWCNINNLPSVYASLLAAVSEVEHALSDVHDLLRTRSGDQEWQREWTEIVQDILRKDSGWELSSVVLGLVPLLSQIQSDGGWLNMHSWTTFWRMVCMNMGQLKDPPLIVNPTWPITPETHRPSFAETKDIVERLVGDYTNTRSNDVKHISGLPKILDTLRSILSP